MSLGLANQYMVHMESPGFSREEEVNDVDGAHVPEIGFMFKRIMSEFNERIDNNAHVNKDMLMDAFNNMMDGYPVGMAVEFALTAI